MAERKPIEQTDAAAASPPKTELPQVESPSLSPAAPEPLIEPAAPTVETAPTPIAKPDFVWTPRRRRAALLAASVMLAAALGASMGALTSYSLAAKPPVDAAGLEERTAMQQSIVHLTKEVASLKTSLDAANKTAHSEIAKIADRLAAADITGSVTPAQSAIPLPTPRPTLRENVAIGATPTHAGVLQDWTLRSARDGMAYVQGHGEIYEAVLGAPLPGLGPVEAIKRQDWRWMVVTPKGIIVSAHDRYYFE